MDGEQQLLFGAGPGPLTFCTIHVATPVHNGYWFLRLEVYTEMRKEPMVMKCELYGDQQPQEVLGAMHGIVHKACYLKRDTIASHMRRETDRLIEKGYDVLALRVAKRKI